MPTTVSRTRRVGKPSVSCSHGTSRGRGSKQFWVGKRVIEQVNRTSAEHGMFPVEPGDYAWTRKQMAQLVNGSPNCADTRGIIPRRLVPIVSEPALKLANGYAEEVCESLLGSGQGVCGPGKYVADRSIVVVRLIFGDVTQRVAELLKRNTHIPALVFVAVVAERFGCAKRSLPQCCHEVRIGLPA